MYNIELDFYRARLPFSLAELRMGPYAMLRMELSDSSPLIAKKEGTFTQVYSYMAPGTTARRCVTYFVSVSDIKLRVPSVR
jgi:hypothetical protein